MPSSTYPNTNEGRIAKLEAWIEGLESMLATGVLNSSIDGHSVSYRSRKEVEDTLSKWQNELYQRRNSVRTPLGRAFPL